MRFQDVLNYIGLALLSIEEDLEGGRISPSEASLRKMELKEDLKKAHREVEAQGFPVSIAPGRPSPEIENLKVSIPTSLERSLSSANDD